MFSCHAPHAPFPPRFVINLMTRVLLLCLCVFSSALGLSALPTWDLTKPPVPASTKGNHATGNLPPGWRDDSAWADVKVHYGAGLFEGTRWGSIAVREVRRGQVQVVAPFPTDLPKGPVRVTFRARSSAPASIWLSVRDEGEPYKTWWSEQTRLSGNFSDEEFEFEAGPLPRPALFMINIDSPVTVDIAQISFERAAATDAADSRVNLLRNSRLPLGLQAPMTVARDFSEGTHFNLQPDYSPENRGPSGAPSLRMQSEKEFRWDGELIRIRARNQPHTASVHVKGDGVLRLVAMERHNKISERVFRVRAGQDWQRHSITFNPLPNGQNHYIAVFSRGEIWIDGLMVNAGEEALPFAPAHEVELALALPASAASPAGIQFEHEPATVRFLATGQLPTGARVEATVTNSEGLTARLEPVSLTLRDGLAAGEFSFDAIPGKSLGTFRIEARVLDHRNRPLSEWNEIVVSRVKQPRHWGAFAPQSPFGVHVRPTVRHVTMAKAIGANWVRLHNDGNHITAWAILEPRQGEWRWADDDLSRYREGHMEVLGMLETAPKWASLWGQTEQGRAATGGPGYFEMYFQPREIGLFADYVRTVATRYKDQIRAYEVWNEPWQVKWFGSHHVQHEGRRKIATSANPQKDYVALMRAAFETVRSVDPGITVVGVNTTSTTESRHVPEGVFGGAEWTAGVLAAGGKRYADAASFHHYTADLSGFPDDDLTRAVRNAVGPNALVPARVDLPIWMTEGSSTVSGLVRHGLYRHALPYRNGEDALRLTESVLRYDVAMLANGVDKIFLYSMGDIDALGSPGSYRTLVSTDGSLHPSALGRASLAWHVEGLQFDRMLRLKDGVYAYLFANAERSVAVICPRVGHGTLSLPRAREGLVARDLFSNLLPTDAKIGDRSVFLSLEAPLDQLLPVLKSIAKP
jgi:hypothetical protein